MNDDIEYLKEIMQLYGNDWWKNADTHLTVGNLLAHMGVIGTAEQAFEFMEKPRKWQHEIDTLIEEYK